jgi:leucine dehydrogenase
MTYKAAVAETGQGGGKAVIIGDPATDKSEALFRAMGKLIESLGGSYVAAEDMNITVADLEIVASETKYVSGLAREHGSSGNPSPNTAYGCYLSIRTCLDEVFGSPYLRDHKIVIQGVGAVGGALARLCAEAGAEVVVTDLDRTKADALVEKLGVAALAEPDDALEEPCDVLSPCGRGGILSAETIPNLRCRIVAGAANNQLAEPEDGARLQERGILYAPDYVVNAGGIINIAGEFVPEGYDEAAVRAQTQNVPRALKEIFRIAREQNIPTAEAADRLAEERITAGRTKPV